MSSTQNSEEQPQQIDDSTTTLKETTTVSQGPAGPNTLSAESNYVYALMRTYYQSKYSREAVLLAVYKDERAALNALLREHKESLESGSGQNEKVWGNSRSTMYGCSWTTWKLERRELITSVENHIEPEYDGEIREIADYDF
ncbi:1751_t:CDS:1 [Ambispora gerdemannii]|uniref:1751_t:CDS:1 n=1 Tax=Ambispora gerdemannii TaxID=144530 RepID=A0A9N8V1L4_9GLOM|nr:1751_t:CDS:1 [Ambispora gerdemannii]